MDRMKFSELILSALSALIAVAKGVLTAIKCFIALRYAAGAAI